MSLLDSLDPVLKPWAFRLYDLAVAAGVHPRVTSARRTYAQQKALYDAWIKGKGKYEAARPGFSAHEVGLAFDLVVPSSIDQLDLLAVWRSWGGVTLQYDPVHFEYPGFNPTAETVPVAQEAPTPSGMQHKAEQVADLILNTIPFPLRGILNSAVIASQLLTIFGSEAAAALDYLLIHPAEAIDLFYRTMWRELLDRFGL